MFNLHEMVERRLEGRVEEFLHKEDGATPRVDRQDVISY